MGIYSGVAACSFFGKESNKWTRDKITFEVGRTLKEVEFISAIATVSLAAVVNEHEGTCGWAVDEVHASRAENGQVRITADVGVYGNGPELLRLSYHVTAIARVR
jgi:hypothetical protein